MNKFTVTDGTYAFAFPLNKFLNLLDDSYNFNSEAVSYVRQLVADIKNTVDMAEKQAAWDAMTPGEQIVTKLKELDVSARTKFLAATDDKKAIAKLGVETYYRVQQAKDQFDSLADTDPFKIEAHELLLSLASFLTELFNDTPTPIAPATEDLGKVDLVRF